MVELPRSLAPWSSQLNLFPPEVALALGPTVQRLAAAIGSLHTRHQAGLGEPDGLGDLARRGSYERLLLSDWLLAEEMPEEFMRRAAMGEHSFLKLAHREPAQTRLSIAIFDAGPNQMGSPRIAQIAAFIVLTRRAAAAGAVFDWGILQAPDEVFSTEISAASVMALLKARDSREAGAEHFEEWRERIEKENSPSKDATLPEVWLIGGKRLAPLKAEVPWSFLQLQDNYEPDERSVAASIYTTGKQVVEVTLDLPDPSSSARLIRDPFGLDTAAVNRQGSRHPVTSNFVFSTGRKMLARSLTTANENAVVGYATPNSAKAGVGKAKFYPAQQPGPVIAAGRVGTLMALVMLAPYDETQKVRHLYLTTYGNRKGKTRLLSMAIPDTFSWNFDENACSLGICFGLERYARSEEYMVLAGTNLLRIGECNSPDHVVQGTAQIIAKNVLAFSTTNQGASFVTAAHRVRVETTDANEQSVRHPMKASHSIADMGNKPLKSSESETCYIYSVDYKGNIEGKSLSVRAVSALTGYSSSSTDAFGVFALEHGDGRWSVVADLKIQPFTPPSGARVIGAVDARPRYKTPGLVVIERDGFQISLLGRDWKVPLPATTSRIEHATISTTQPLIVYTTEAGDMFVYSFLQDTFFLRHIPAGGQS